MHDGSIATGDAWLSQELPAILNSAAYTNNGAVFLTFDENGSFNSPIMMMVLSPLAKSGGYASTRFYDHSSYVRTMQDIFGVGPYLGDAVNATNLGELFHNPTITPTMVNGVVSVVLSDLPVGKVNYLQASSDMTYWTTIGSGSADAPDQSVTIVDPDPATHLQRFYRVVQGP